MDITEEIAVQHEQQRRAFALLDELPADDADRLGPIWHRLALELEVHAAAEERFFYPLILKLGADSPGGDDAEEETEDAIKDHNEIREGIAEAAKHDVASKGWWDAVRATREANSDHLAEEERDDLAAFRRDASLQLRHDVAVEFLVFQAQHAAQGVTPESPSPEDYIAAHG